MYTDYFMTCGRCKAHWPPSEGAGCPECDAQMDRLVSLGFKASAVIQAQTFNLGDDSELIEILQEMVGAR